MDLRKVKSPGLHTLPEAVEHPPFIYFLCKKTISFIYFKCEYYTHSSTGIIQILVANSHNIRPKSEIKLNR